jgi:hypothetical protein
MAEVGMFRHLWIGLAASFLLSAPAHAQHPLFSDSSELDIVIEAPLTTLLRTARRNTDPHPGTLILQGQGEPERYDLQLSARGMSRRVGDICRFPPLRVDLRSNRLRETIFRGQGRLKLTTHCRPTASYESLYVLEYTAYRLYNELTPMSYRARPLRVTYRDSEGRRGEETRFGFFVEDVDDLARRNQRVALDIQTGVVRASQLNAEAATRLALFQFMIGNLDWDMIASASGRDCCHNVRLLAASQGAHVDLIPAPYDFDYSGLVSAPYATPPPSIPVSNVRARYYRGYCIHNAEVPAAIALFQSRREALNRVIASETRLPEARRRTVQTYLDGFFELIGDPSRVQSLILNRCRQSTG